MLQVWLSFQINTESTENTENTENTESTENIERNTEITVPEVTRGGFIKIGYFSVVLLGVFKVVVDVDGAEVVDGIVGLDVVIGILGVVKGGLGPLPGVTSMGLRGLFWLPPSGLFSFPFPTTVLTEFLSTGATVVVVTFGLIQLGRTGIFRPPPPPLGLLFELRHA